MFHRRNRRFAGQCQPLALMRILELEGRGEEAVEPSVFRKRVTRFGFDEHKDAFAGFTSQMRRKHVAEGSKNLDLDVLCISCFELRLPNVYVVMTDDPTCTPIHAFDFARVLAPSNAALQDMLASMPVVTDKTPAYVVLYDKKSKHYAVATDGTWCSCECCFFFHLF